MTRLEAAALTSAFWDQRRPDMIRWLRARGFTPPAAARALRSFIDTQIFVAEETGEPQIGQALEPTP